MTSMLSTFCFTVLLAVATAQIYDTCMPCQLVIQTAVEKYNSDFTNVSEMDLFETLYPACNKYWDYGNRFRCEIFVRDYFEDILKWLQHGVGQVHICGMVGLCNVQQ